MFTFVPHKNVIYNFKRCCFCVVILSKFVRFGTSKDFAALCHLEELLPTLSGIIKLKGSLEMCLYEQNQTLVAGTFFEEWTQRNERD